jgi:hypothetical protein
MTWAACAATSSGASATSPASWLASAASATSPASWLASAASATSPASWLDSAAGGMRTSWADGSSAAASCSLDTSTSTARARATRCTGSTGGSPAPPVIAGSGQVSSTAVAGCGISAEIMSAITDPPLAAFTGTPLMIIDPGRSICETRRSLPRFTSSQRRQNRQRGPDRRRLGQAPRSSGGGYSGTTASSMSWTPSRRCVTTAARALAGSCVAMAVRMAACASSARNTLPTS